MTVSPEITHEGLCCVDGCPWPSDPDMHIPWCSHGLVGHHQHIPKRSQDTKAKIQAFICPRCHDKIDNGLWSNHIKTFPDGSVHYFILDEHGKTKTDRVVQQGRQEVAGDLDLRQAQGEAGESSKQGLTVARGHDYHIDFLPEGEPVEPQILPAVQQPNIVSVTLPVFPRGITPNLMGLEFDDLVTYEEWAAIGP